MAVRIIPRLVRGRLYFQVADVLFPTLRLAASAWSAAECHRLDIAEVSPVRPADRSAEADADRAEAMELQLKAKRAGGAS